MNFTIPYLRTSAVTDTAYFNQVLKDRKLEQAEFANTNKEKEKDLFWLQSRGDLQNELGNRVCLISVEFNCTFSFVPKRRLHNIVRIQGILSTQQVQKYIEELHFGSDIERSQ